MTTSLFKSDSDASGPPIDAPSQATSNIGDVAFDQSTGQRQEFQDVSTSTSFSYGFNGNSAIEVDSSVTAFFDSTKRFSQQFSTFITSQSSSPLLSYNLNNVGGNACVHGDNGIARYFGSSTASAAKIRCLNDSFTDTDHDHAFAVHGDLA